MEKLPDHYKSWIAENLISGADPEVLKENMAIAGISPALAAAEVDKAMSHPYLEAGRKVKQQLKRRESLLKTLDRHLRNIEGYSSIEKTDLPSYKDFLRDYYFQNRPGLFRNAVPHWEALKWTPRSMMERVGAEVAVQVQFNRDSNADYESNNNKYRKEMKFGEFVDMVEGTESSNNFYLTANNAAFANGAMKPLVADIGDIGDGWLETENTEQQAHLWIGPSGTITPLHHDLTNNLFIQLHGRKKFRMIPSMQVPYMYNQLHVYSQVDLLNPDLQSYPEYGNVTILEFDVEPGDLLFIPMGWWHHVVGLSANISLTLTNFNRIHGVGHNSFVQYPNGSESRYEPPKEQENSAAMPEKAMGALPIDAAWQGWVHENLNGGADPKEILKILIKNNFSLDAIKRAMGDRFPSEGNRIKQYEAVKNSIKNIDYAALSKVRITDTKKSGAVKINDDRVQLYTLDDFMTGSECDEMVGLINNYLRPSTVAGEQNDKYFRTSSTCDLIHKKDKLIALIDKRIAETIGINLSYSEGIQGQRYLVGQEFKPHADYFTLNTKEYDKYCSQQGNRTWTFMIYLNDEGLEGGGTRFTAIKHEFQPKKGRAVIWNNLHPDGSVNPFSIHAGLPVDKGEKFVITKWFREVGKGQMLPE